MLAQDGRGVIRGMSIIALGLLALGVAGLSFGWSPFLGAALVILALAVMAFTLYFFRDPERTSPVDAAPGAVISPADGRIIVIQDVAHEPIYLKGPATLISIFMSPLNVHVNRIPIDGEVAHVAYHPGQFKAAFESVASEVNERAIFGIQSAAGKVLFQQVAGFIARRIVYHLTPGDRVRVGERFGMIKFGSRVDVWLPAGSKIQVQLGDLTSAGVTVLGLLPGGAGVKPTPEVSRPVALEPVMA